MRKENSRRKEKNARQENIKVGGRENHSDLSHICRRMEEKQRYSWQDSRRMISSHIFTRMEEMVLPVGEI